MTRRSALLGLLSLPLAAAAPRVARADLFGGDIGVLLAQLEQMLTMVSKAFETVEGIARTVEQANAIRQHAKTFLEKAKSGGVMGWIHALGQVSRAGASMARGLQTVNIRGGQWRDNITATIQRGDSMSLGDMTRLTNDVNNMNRQMIRDMANMSKAVAGLSGSYDALDASAKALEAAAITDGIVGQTQLLGQQIHSASIIAAHQDAIATLNAQQTAQRYTMEAADRERSRAAAAQLMKGFRSPLRAQAVEEDPNAAGIDPDSVPTDVNLEGSP